MGKGEEDEDEDGGGGGAPLWSPQSSGLSACRGPPGLRAERMSGWALNQGLAGRSDWSLPTV